MANTVVMAFNVENSRDQVDSEELSEVTAEFYEIYLLETDLYASGFLLSDDCCATFVLRSLLCIELCVFCLLFFFF